MTRVGVLGAGIWGINHVRVLASEPACTELVVADVNPARAAHVRDVATHARFTRSLDELLPLVDALVIASPAALHAEHAVRALDAGKHVLVEKPLALSRAAAADIVAAATRAVVPAAGGGAGGPAAGEGDRPVAMVGHLMVFHPVVRRLRELVRSGTLGRPYYVTATRVNLGRLRDDETALWCFGPHDLSMIDAILGEQPIEVSACGQAMLQPRIEDVVFVTLRYASGVMANLMASWLHPRKERRLTLVCGNQMAEFDDVAREKLKVYDRGYDRVDFKEFAEFLSIRDGDVHIPHVPMVEPLRVELQHFLQCIADRTVPETDLASALRVTAILEAAERSIRLGGAPQPVETP